MSSDEEQQRDELQQPLEIRRQRLLLWEALGKMKGIRVKSSNLTAIKQLVAVGMILFVGFGALSAWMIVEGILDLSLWSKMTIVSTIIMICHGLLWQKYREHSICKEYIQRGLVVYGKYNRMDGCLEYSTTEQRNVHVKKKIGLFAHLPDMIQMPNRFREMLFPSVEEDEDSGLLTDRIRVIVLPTYVKSGRLESDIQEQLPIAQTWIRNLKPVVILGYTIVTILVVGWIRNLILSSSLSRRNLFDFILFGSIFTIEQVLLCICIRKYASREYYLNGNDAVNGMVEIMSPTTTDSELYETITTTAATEQQHVPLLTSPWSKDRPKHIFSTIQKDPCRYWMIVVYYVAFVVASGYGIIQWKHDTKDDDEEDWSVANIGFPLSLALIFSWGIQYVLLNEHLRLKIWNEYQQHGERVVGEYNDSGYLVYTTTGACPVVVEKRIETKATSEPGPVNVLYIPDHPRSGRFEQDIHDLIQYGHDLMKKVLPIAMVCFTMHLVVVIWWHIEVVDQWHNAQNNDTSATANGSSRNHYNNNDDDDYSNDVTSFWEFWIMVLADALFLLLFCCKTARRSHLLNGSDAFQGDIQVRHQDC